MQIVQIGLDGVVTPNRLNIGNKYENNDEKLILDLPQEYKDYTKYMIAVMRAKEEGEKDKTIVLPIQDNVFTVSSALTWTEGDYYLYVMCRENTLDLGQEVVDITAKDGEHVFISNGFIGTIAKSYIDADNVKNAPLDSNLQTIYDDLVTLKEEFKDIISGGGTVTSIAWDKVSGKPTEFPPTQHDHNDLYYGKTEVDDKLNAKLDKYQGKNQVGKTLMVGDDGNVQFIDLVNDVIPQVIPPVVGDVVEKEKPKIVEAAVKKVEETITPTIEEVNKTVNTHTSQIAQNASDIELLKQSGGSGVVTWEGVQNKPNTFPPDAHAHTKTEISDMPTSLSDFSNDVGYLTDVPQDYVAETKAELDKKPNVSDFAEMSNNDILAVANKILFA